MTALEIIEKLHALGAEIQVNGDRLKINAPVGIVTPELKSVIVDRKPEIIEALTTFRPGSIVRPIPVRFNVEHPPAVCLMDSCDGDLLTRDSLFVCDSCGVWYSNAGALRPEDLLCLTNRDIVRPQEVQTSLEFEKTSETVH